MEQLSGGFLITQIKQIQGRLFEKLLCNAGIEEFNGAQGRILYVLWQEDDLPIVELSKRTGLAKTTLTGMLDRMQEKGHLCRNYNENDRRQIRITLSEKARSLRSEYKLVSKQMSSLFYKNFKEEEIILFEEYLIRILDNLTQAQNNGLLP